MLKTVVGVVCVIGMGAFAEEPERWRSLDVGKCALKGSAVSDEATSSWTITGGGVGIRDNADGFHFLYRRLRGDGEIVARVVSCTSTLGGLNIKSRAGVMMRESTSANCRFAYSGLAQAGKWVAFLTRAQPGDVASFASSRLNLIGSTGLPLWFKLNRRGSTVTAYVSANGRDWKMIPGGTNRGLISKNPETVEMPGDILVGLAVASPSRGLNTARVDHVMVNGEEGIGIFLDDTLSDDEIAGNPSDASSKAFRVLQEIGNWAGDPEIKKSQGDRIAAALLTVARVKELDRGLAPEALADYYRIVKEFPGTPASLEAVARIAVLDEGKGLDFMRDMLKDGSVQDAGLVYQGTIEISLRKKDDKRAGELLAAFAQWYLASRPNADVLTGVLDTVASAENSGALSRGLVQASMAKPSGDQLAAAVLRHMALRSAGPGGPVVALAKWAVSEYGGTRLATCARAVLADMEYAKGNYVEALKAFQPDLFADGQSEVKTIERVNACLVAYQAGTLRQAAGDLAPVYRALAAYAENSKLYAVAVHCQKKRAEIRGVSLDVFQKAARPGTKVSACGPQMESLFWQGFMAAEEGDLMTAARAYGEFLKAESDTVMSARAWYDVARIKMAQGMDASEAIARAKAISPCEPVVKLEGQLEKKAS